MVVVVEDLLAQPTNEVNPRATVNRMSFFIRTLLWRMLFKVIKKNCEIVKIFPSL